MIDDYPHRSLERLGVSPRRFPAGALLCAALGCGMFGCSEESAEKPAAKGNSQPSVSSSTGGDAVPEAASDARTGNTAGGAGERAPAPDEPEPPEARFQFQDEAAARGLVHRNHCGAEPPLKRYLVEEIGNGCAFLDFDGDGDQDALLVDGCGIVPPGTEVDAPPGQMPPSTPEDWLPAFDGRTRLYANDGSGRFQDVSEAAGIDYRGSGSGAVAGDLDNDGDPEIYLTAWGPNRLYRNRGSGKFEDVTEEAGVGDPHWSVGACLLDADQDGSLDLYVANYFALTTARDPDVWRKIECPHYDMEVACGPLTMVGEPDSFFRNRGDGTFEDRSQASGIRKVESRYALGVVAFDSELDGDTDVYVANDSRGNYLFLNDGKAQFEELADLAGLSLNEKGLAQAGMGVGLGDYDNDLDLDLFLTNFAYDDNTLYRNEGDNLWLDVTKRMAFGETSYFALGWGTDFVDFDLDGDLDLFVANGHIFPEVDARAPELTYLQLNRLFENHAGLFREATTRSGPGMQKLSSTRGAAFADVDHDGDIDVLLVEMNDAPSLLINGRDPSPREFLTLTLEGTQCSRDAVGTKVEAFFTGHQQMQEVRRGHSFAGCNAAPLLFATAGEDLVRLRVSWLGGAVQDITDVSTFPHSGWLHLKQGQAVPSVRNVRQGE